MNLYESTWKKLSADSKKWNIPSQNEKEQKIKLIQNCIKYKIGSSASEKIIKILGKIAAYWLRF